MIKNVIFDFGNVLTQYDPVAWAADVMNNDFKKGKYLHDKTIDNKKSGRTTTRGCAPRPRSLTDCAPTSSRSTGTPSRSTSKQLSNAFHSTMK